MCRREADPDLAEPGWNWNVSRTLVQEAAARAARPSESDRKRQRVAAEPPAAEPPAGCLEHAKAMAASAGITASQAAAAAARLASFEVLSHGEPLNARDVAKAAGQAAGRVAKAAVMAMMAAEMQREKAAALQRWSAAQRQSSSAAFGPIALKVLGSRDPTANRKHQLH